VSLTLFRKEIKKNKEMVFEACIKLVCSYCTEYTRVCMV